MVSNTQNTIKLLVAFFENLGKYGYEAARKDDDSLLIKRDGFLVGQIKENHFVPAKQADEAESFPIHWVDNSFYLCINNGQKQPLREALDKIFDREVKELIDMINQAFEE